MNKLLWLIVFLLPGIVGKAQGIILNELAASVSNSQVDNYGEYEDWIEIFNGSEYDVNLAGWYLSDNPAKPIKWRIPDSNPSLTTVRSKSCLLFWADQDTTQGPDHLGFSLKRKGEVILLSRPGKDGPILVDSVKYGVLLTDHSYGRCPDRNNEWIRFKHPTPNKPNICTVRKKK